MDLEFNQISILVHLFYELAIIIINGRAIRPIGLLPVFKIYQLKFAHNLWHRVFRFNYSNMFSGRG